MRHRRNPALDGMTPETFVSLVIAELPSTIRVAVEQHRPLLVPIAARLLDRERTTRAAATAPPAPARVVKGSVKERLGEPVVHYTTEEAKDAVLEMAGELGALPPPGSGVLKDDVGFSAATNTPMRMFLARVGAGEDVPLIDYLRAARLLIVHSKGQLPRVQVMGAIRALEDAVPKVKPLAAGVTAPPSSAYGIVNPRRDDTLDEGLGQTAWEWSGGNTVRVQIPNKLRYKKAAAEVPGVRMVNHRGAWRLNVPLSSVGMLAQWLAASGAKKGAARLLAALHSWLVAHPGTVQTLDDGAGAGSGAGGSGAGAGAGGSGGAPRAPSIDAKELASGWAGPTKRSGARSDFDSVWWEWKGGPTVDLAMSYVSGGTLDGDTQRAGGAGQIIGRWLRSKDLPQTNDRTTAIPGSSYKRYWSTYRVADVPLIAKGLRELYGRRTEAADKLDALGPAWAAKAGAQPGTPPEVRPAGTLNPVGGSLLIAEGYFRWAFDKSMDAVSLIFPFDSRRGPQNQIFGALRKEGITHRRLGHRLLLSTESVERLRDLLSEEGRFPGALAPIAQMLPFWKALEADYHPKATQADTRKTARLLRRLRGSMAATTAEQALRRLDAYAPYVANTEPGDTKGDLGPHGRWAIANTAPDPRTGATGGELRIYMGGLGPDLNEMELGWAVLDGQKNDPRAEFYYRFNLTHVEDVVRALDNVGLFALALAIRTATLVSSTANPCPVLDALADTHSLLQLEDPAVASFVRDTYKDVKRKLAPGMDLREYQQIAVAYAKEAGYRAIIGDAMGLGKTPTAIGALLSDPGKLLPALVVAPTSVVGVWPVEIQKFAPHLRVVSANEAGSKTTTAYLKELLGDPSWQVMVMSWTSLRLVQQELLAAVTSGRIHTVIYDEVHYAKRATAAMSKAAKALAHAAPYRLFLSGTPIENKAEELWHPLSMLNPVAYGDIKDFRERFGGGSKGKRTVMQIDPATGKPLKRIYKTQDKKSKTNAEKAAHEMDELRVALRCDMVRRLKSDVLSELPPKTRVFEPLPLSPKDTQAYAATITRMHRWLCSSLTYSVAMATAQHMAAAKANDRALTPTEALQEYVLSHVGVDGADDLGVPFSEANMEQGTAALLQPQLLVAHGAVRRVLAHMKAPYVAERVLEHMQSSDTPVVVFGQHKPVIKTLTDAFEKAGKRWTVIDGSTPASQRAGRVRDFQAGKYDVIVGSQAMREGVTLTRADDLFFAEQWWNPAKIEQAEDRIHRADELTLAKPGGVTIHHPLVPHTIDDDMIAVLAEKRAGVRAVLGAEKTKVRGSDGRNPTVFLRGAADAVRKLGGGTLLGCLPTDAQIKAAQRGELEKPPALDAPTR